MNIESIYQTQKTFFETNTTLDYHFRKAMLKRLYQGIIRYREKLVSALRNDLSKGETEAILTEIWIVLSEIKFHQKHLQKWMKPKRVKTPLVLKPGKSYQIAQPLGVNLILSPWNYPLHLALMPLVGAISSGGTAVIKPSSQTAESAKVLQEMIRELFEPQYVTVVIGNHDVADELLNQPFDHIFFTGSTALGKKIAAIGAKNLTKVTLELGGKSPAIIHNVTRIDKIAQRLLFGKIINAGQTCVAPDYVICHKSMLKSTVNALNYYLKEMLGENPCDNEDYPRIISEKHFDRLTRYLENANILGGGTYNRKTLKISPTFILLEDINAPIMQEEIFGPILPIITYQDEEEIFEIIKRHPNPLALYVFSENKFFNNRIISGIKSGGVSVNDTISHLVNHHLPFGGIFSSGMGSYHGYQSFLTFSHFKSVYEKHPRMELKIKYPPYSERTKKIIKRFFLK